jgi:hypothetical protein
MTDPEVRVGRCQHCEQIRPVFHYDLRHDNGDEIWDQPYPPYWNTTGAWLCARHWSQADTCRINGLSFHVDHELEVWPWNAAKIRTWANGEEVLTQADRDLQTCRAILAASEGAHQ